VRAAATQERLQLTHLIPRSRVTAVPLMPDAEHFHLHLERAQLSPALTAHDLTMGSHSLSVQRLASPSPFVGATTTYSFDGQRFYVTFEEPQTASGGGAGGAQRVAVADVLRFDACVWSAAKAFLDAHVLAPLSLPTSRIGWTLSFDEFLDPFAQCAAHVQTLRSVYDAEELASLKLRGNGPAAATAAAAAGGATAVTMATMMTATTGR
jgi:hypothetical protein